ncbi:putative Cornichon protein [Trachipleistophora hominis]|uniref:Putative Cornichon protein n=1 Tax=Trachipleistophora hominis TaxID=72359 RepID=L7JXR3_TRAHO|nr:putative Cornichon protein [Trachipleistophora hominis]
MYKSISNLQNMFKTIHTSLLFFLSLILTSIELHKLEALVHFEKNYKISHDIAYQFNRLVTSEAVPFIIFMILNFLRPTIILLLIVGFYEIHKVVKEQNFVNPVYLKDEVGFRKKEVCLKAILYLCLFVFYTLNIVTMMKKALFG